jgi:ribosomal protein L37AE/L43A
MQLMLHDVVWLTQRLEYFVRSDGCVLCVLYFPEQDHKFIAPKTAHSICAMQTVRCWSLLTLGDQRQYGGNQGYADDPEVCYRYDSSVANSRQVSEGDLVLVRDGTRVLGVARVESVDTRPGVKRRQRCPECRTTAIKRRAKRALQWRCNNGHEFANPIIESSGVTARRSAVITTSSSESDGA